MIFDKSLKFWPKILRFFEFCCHILINSEDSALIGFGDIAYCTYLRDIAQVLYMPTHCSVSEYIPEISIHIYDDPRP